MSYKPPYKRNVGNIAWVHGGGATLAQTEDVISIANLDRFLAPRPAENPAPSKGRRRGQ